MRYTGPIIDAHHHFWQPRLGKQPWLRPEVQLPFRYGNYEAIKKDYLPPDLLRDAEGFNIVGTVTMETEWELDDPMGEMRYMQEMAKKYGLPTASVAHAVLVDPKVEDTLGQLAEIDLVRAVRNKPGEAKSYREADSYRTLMSDPQWREGFSRLRSHGLVFDLQVSWFHIDEILALLDAFPEQTVVYNHAGLPADRCAEALARWQRAISQLAKREQVYVKASGIGVPGKKWTVELNGHIVEHLAQTFGPERMMFASNFPVDSLTGSYQEIFGGFVEITKDWSPDEQRAAFGGVATAVYRLPPELMESAR